MGVELLASVSHNTVEVMEAELLELLAGHEHHWDSGSMNWEAKMRNEQAILAHIHYLVGVHDTHIGDLMNKAIATDPQCEDKIRSYFAYWTRPL